MRIKLDENMPVRLAEIIRQLGHDADTVLGEGLSGGSDDAVWKAAQEAGRFFITQDLDFSDLRRFEPGKHYGILLVRLREPGRNALVKYVEAAFSQENVTIWQGCFVILTEHKLRVYRPKDPK
jgi:predicted nuclease of predicted toxin-antitoxin system